MFCHVSHQLTNECSANYLNFWPGSVLITNKTTVAKPAAPDAIHIVKKFHFFLFTSFVICVPPDIRLARLYQLSGATWGMRQAWDGTEIRKRLLGGKSRRKTHVRTRQE